MAVLEDDLGSEQTLEKILEQTNTLWEAQAPRTKSHYLATIHIVGYKYTQFMLKAWKSNV